MLVVTVIALPIAVQAFMTFLSDDATEANADDLTGIPNRRGFLRAARRPNAGADNAMYAAKRSGDAVVVHSPTTR